MSFIMYSVMSNVTDTLSCQLFTVLYEKRNWCFRQFSLCQCRVWWPSTSSSVRCRSAELCTAPLLLTLICPIRFNKYKSRPFPFGKILMCFLVYAVVLLEFAIVFSNLLLYFLNCYCVVQLAVVICTCRPSEDTLPLCDVHCLQADDN